MFAWPLPVLCPPPPSLKGVTLLYPPRHWLGLSQSDWLLSPVLAVEYCV